MLKVKYGCKKDKPDKRDYIWQPPPVTLARSTDLRSKCPPIYDQGALGSCTAQAIAGNIQFDRMKVRAKPSFIPSRLFIYYNERAMEGTINQDAGASIRDGIKSVNRWGVCPEQYWPYDIPKFTYKPSSGCYIRAKRYLSVVYYRIASVGKARIKQIKQTLIAGYPVIFCFKVYESFESANVTLTGNVPMPAEGEQLLGGHAVLAVGYNTSRFLVRNSWGTWWGDNGYCRFPYDYIMSSSLTFDIWVIKTMTR